jgi:hypothetical protein
VQFISSQAIYNGEPFKKNWGQCVSCKKKMDNGGIFKTGCSLLLVQKWITQNNLKLKEGNSIKCG